MTFSALGLRPPLLSTLEALAYLQPTPVQKQAIPAILAGRDVLAAAPTGTGKTAAFALPLLQKFSTTVPDAPGVQVLILVPTRELAEQVMAACKRYAAALDCSVYAAYGGVNTAPQIQRLAAGVDILVATPGRLLDLFTRGALSLRAVTTLVLDEADRMLDLGFAADLEVIFQALPSTRQTLLFSATFAPEINTLASRRLRKPLRIEASPRPKSVPAIRQWVVPVDKKKKTALFLFMRRDRNWQQILLFVRTRQSCEALLARLHELGISAATLHGERTQAERQAALAAFKAGEVDILIATDLAARGLDINALPLVVNYDLPDQAADYIHRIGRTGRAGLTGEAVSLVCADEAPRLAAIEQLLQKPLARDEEPGFEPQHRVPPTAPGIPARTHAGKNLARANKISGRSNWVDEFAPSRSPARPGARHATPTGSPRKGGGRGR
ncbi:DEAD/DEAH box helicase [Azonexus sp.]|uniref:DEAD/DEAH box helicase n=1 Tax=Azonexus sp. TaxID=1872668 RepID=UPI0039E2EFFF